MNGQAAETARVLGDIAAERADQIGRGYDTAHDDAHRDGVLAAAASCYAAHAAFYREDAALGVQYGYKPVPRRWPWQASFWRPRDPRRDLVRAAALIVAEIERLDRLDPGAAANAGGRQDEGDRPDAGDSHDGTAA